MAVQPARNRFRVTQSMGTCSRFRARSALAVEVDKIASDLRLLSSGRAPGCGKPAPHRTARILDHAGKVNPSVPEMVNQVCQQVLRLRRRDPGVRGGGTTRAERHDARDGLERAARHDDPWKRDAGPRRPLRQGNVRRRSALPGDPRSQTPRSPPRSAVHRHAQTADIAKTAGQDGPIDCGDRPRAAADPGRQTRADPLTEEMTTPGIPGGTRNEGAEHPVIAMAAFGAPALAQHARLFPPEKSACSRGGPRRLPAARSDHGRAPDRRRQRRRGPGCRRRWFTVRLARRVGPNGRVYAEDVSFR